MSRMDGKKTHTHIYIYIYITTTDCDFGVCALATNVGVQYKGGLLPDIILLTLFDYFGQTF